MKSKKFWKGVLSFLCFVIVATAINMGIKVAMEGMWLLGIPKPEAVSSVTIKHQYETEQIKEITDPEQIETCVFLTGFLKYRPFADPEIATGKASPLITVYYHLNNGDTVEVSANANTVFYNGKKHVLKDDDSFVNFVEGLFFNDSVLYGRISEIADGNLLIEADGKSYIIYDWMEYIPTGPSFEIGDEVEITHHGIAPVEEPAGLYGVSKIDLTHDAYIRKYGNEGNDDLPDGALAICIDGVTYYGIGFPVPVEPDESAIEYVEIPAGGGATITAFARLDEGKLIVCRIDGEWYQFHSLEALASSQIDLEIPDGDEKPAYIIEVCQNWLYENESDSIIATITNMDTPTLKSLNELPLQGNYLSLTEDSGESPYYEVTFTTTADDILGPITFLLNQNTDIIGIYYRE